MPGIQIPGGYQQPNMYPGAPQGYYNPTQLGGQRQRPDLYSYRKDSGQNMTDAEYNRWLNSRQGGFAGMQTQSNIQTDATKALADQQAMLRQQGETHGAKLQSEAEQRRMGMFSPYLDKMMQGFQNMQSGSGPGAGGPTLPTVQQVDFGAISGAEDAARAAAFARAKDQAGLVARSAMSGLNNAMAGRGLARSRMAGGGAANIINRGANQLGEVTREQQIQDYNRAAQRASEYYQGQISQRGQDVTQRGQDVTQRGQDINADLARRQMYMQSLSGLMNQFPGQITARY